MKSRPLVLATLLASAVFSQSVAAQAPLTTRVVTGVGGWIAMQGNEALREIRKQLEREVVDHLQPLLPMPQPGEKPQPEPRGARS